MDVGSTDPPKKISDADAIVMAQASIDLHEQAARSNEPGAALADDPGFAQIAETLELIGQLGLGALGEQGTWNSEPIMLGHFQILGERGRGGFGIVLKAYDPDLKREVALKIPLPERLLAGESPDEIVHEAQLAARLEHPGIVRVYEAGRLGPIWYIASAYCKGPTLTKWLEQQARPLPPRLAAHIVESIAGAVHYAHSRGVLHLDLKPDNILVEEAWEAGAPIQTLVTDFGLAGLREQVAAGSNQRFGGTVEYMAPEQLAGETGSIGVAADVYALGAILYDLLTQRSPHRNSDYKADRDSDPAHPPSRPPTATLPPDMDAVTQKCLHPAMEQRCSSAHDLMQELRRFIDGIPVRARRAPWSERAIRWSIRKPVIATLLGCLLLTITAGVVVASLLWQRAEQHLAEARLLLYAANMKLSEAAWSEHNLRALDALLRPFDSTQNVGADLRGWEWYYFQQLCHQDLRTFKVGGDFECSTIDRGTEIMILGTADGNLLAIDTSSGNRLWKLDAFAGNVTAVAISDDGQRFAAVDRKGECKYWENLTKPLLLSQTCFSYGAVQAAAFDRQLKHIALSDPAFGIHYWNLESRHEVTRFTGHTANITALAISANREQVVSGSEDGSIRIWDIDSAEPNSGIARSAGSPILGITLSPDGRYIAAGAQDGTVLVWEIGKGEPVFHHRRHTDAVNVVRISADNKYLISAGTSRSIQVFSLLTGEHLRTIWGHEERVSSIVLTRDNSRFLAASHDGTVKEWAVRQPDCASPQPLVRDVGNAVFSEDGRTLALRFIDGAVSIRAWPEMQELNRFQGPAGLDALAYDAQQKLCAVSRKDAAIEVWRGGERIHTLEHHRLPVRCLAFSVDGSLLAAAGRDGVISVWDPVKGTQLHRLEQEREAVSVAFDPRCPLLAASTGNRVKLFDVHTGQLQVDINTLEHTVYGVSYSHDGSRLLAGDRSGAILVWDTHNAVPFAKLNGHSDRVYTCCVSPDNRRLVSCSRDKTIRWWDLTTQRELCAMRGDWIECETLVLSPDGWTLLSIGKDKSLRTWDPRYSSTETPPMSDNSPVNASRRSSSVPGVGSSIWLKRR